MFEITKLAAPKDGPAPRWFHVAVAASMIISAVSALIATMHTGQTMTALVEQNARMVRAASTPILQFSHGNQTDDGRAVLNFSLRNAGNGLARVVWFELRVDGQPMGSMEQAVKTLVPAAPVIEHAASNTIAKRVLAAGGNLHVFGWQRPADDQVQLGQAWATLDKARFGKMEVQACYCSVFEECWTSTMNGDVPKPVQDCGAPRKSLNG